MALTHVDLFTGIGGFALAAKWAGFTTVAFVEIEPYAQEVIRKNFMADGIKPRRLEGQSGRLDVRREEPGRIRQEQNGSACASSVPRLYTDIRDFDGTRYRGATLLTGGFPCQPFSQAGKRRGAEDDRALWPEMFRVIREARPTWVVGENVAGIVTMELDNVLSDLEGEGYSVQPLVIPACAVDARHRRDRVWIVANNANSRTQGVRGWQDSISETMGDSAHAERRQRERDNQQSLSSDYCWGQSESDVCGMAVRLPDELDEGKRFYSYQDEWEGVPRVASGVKNRVDRLKGLGNSIQVQVAYEILREIARSET